MIAGGGTGTTSPALDAAVRSDLRRASSVSSSLSFAASPSDHPHLARASVRFARRRCPSRILRSSSSGPAASVRRTATVHLDVTLGELRQAREDLLTSLLEEVVWQFRRQDWSRQDLVNMMRSMPQLVGPEFAFPSKET